MTRLNDVYIGYDNNLNLLRALAAFAVLVSHAWPIALGRGTPEPLSALTGYSLGALAVLVFFAISGFLITASFDRSRSPRSFLIARILRLFPGLLVNLLFVAFLLGPLVTVLPVRDYFASPEVYSFVLRNFTLLFLLFELPGVFQDQPYPPIVGSIWTLIYEVACYGGVFLLGLLGLLRKRGLITALLLAYFGLWLTVQVFEISLYHRFEKLLRLSLPFAFGMGAYLWRDRIVLSLWGGLGLAGLAALLMGTPAYYLALCLAISYTTFWLAYIPGGRIRAYNRVGDYSYGIYIYAFPMQGFAVWLAGPQTPWENILYATPLTLALAMLSWHLVEKPAMALKPMLLRQRLSPST